jgi:hypothetical protein
VKNQRIVTKIVNPCVRGQSRGKAALPSGFPDVAREQGQDFQSATSASPAVEAMFKREAVGAPPIQEAGRTSNASILYSCLTTECCAA